MVDQRDEYFQLNSGAHRKSSIRIRAPALTCHLAFWIPDGFDEGSRSGWISRVDDLICDIIRRHRAWKRDEPSTCEGSKLDTQFGETIVLIDRCVRADDLRTQTLGPADQKLDDLVHSDYRNISMATRFVDYVLSISFESHVEYIAVSMNMQWVKPDRRGANAPHRFFSGIEKSFSALNAHLRKDSGADSESNTRELSEATEILYASFWNTIIDKVLGISFDDTGMSAIGRVFADFRGVIISDETRTFRDQSFGGDLGRPAPHWGDTAVPGLQRIIGDMQHEITASYMLSGRALYLTNLGPQSVHSSHRGRVPTQYIIYAHQIDLSDRRNKLVSKWQLGRLVDRLHRLGVHRLAALKDISQMRAASQVLSRLDKMQKITTDARDEESSNSREALIAMQRNMRTLPRNITSGLLYRTERSRYYVANFRRMVQNLRISRVEGYQPYDSFIEQRLGATFDFIDRLGIRYERAERVIAQKREDAYFDELVSIQRFGEAALLIGLAPYYLSHLLEMSGLTLGFTQLATFSLWSLGVVTFVARSNHRKRSKEELTERIQAAQSSGTMDASDGTSTRSSRVAARPSETTGLRGRTPLGRSLLFGFFWFAFSIGCFVLVASSLHSAFKWSRCAGYRCFITIPSVIPEQETAKSASASSGAELR